LEAVFEAVFVCDAVTVGLAVIEADLEGVFDGVAVVEAVLEGVIV